MNIFKERGAWYVVTANPLRGSTVFGPYYQRPKVHNSLRSLILQTVEVALETDGGAGLDIIIEGTYEYAYKMVGKFLEP